MDIDQRMVIPGKLISSTGEKMYSPSVIPKDKRQIEIFWVEQLLYRLAYFSDKKFTLHSNTDDSNGNHDVIIDILQDRKIGVQVTELTRELQRSLTDKRDKYVNKIINELKANNILSSHRVVFSIYFSELDLRNPQLLKPKRIAKLIKDKAENADFLIEKLEPTDFGQINTTLIGSSDFCVPNYNNIGIDINFDELPRTFAMYKAAIDGLLKKKSKSQSHVLVIWSTLLGRDKHWVMNDLVKYMIEAFRSSHFLNVYLIESVDGDGWFQANLSINIIKTGGTSPNSNNTCSV